MPESEKTHNLCAVPHAYRGPNSLGNLDHSSCSGFTECLYSTTPPSAALPAAARSFAVAGRSEMI